MSKRSLCIGLALFVSVLFVGRGANAAAPTATTGEATDITDVSATLNGTVNPGGEATTYHFDIGTDETLTAHTSTATASAGSGSADVDVTADVTGLSPSTTYYFRVVATNGTSTVSGAINSFVTEAPGAAPCTNCADFDGDGFTDILYWNRNTGRTVVWFMGGDTGTTKLSDAAVQAGSRGFPNTSWIPVSTQDFDGDGYPDILYWNRGTGRLVVWFLGGDTGTTKLSDAPVEAGSRGFPATTWVPVSANDFDGDGYADILFWNKDTGRLVVWFLGGDIGVTKLGDASIKAGSRGFPTTAWIPLSTADFDADGFADLFYWNKSTGRTVVWFLGGSDGTVKEADGAISAGSRGFPVTSWVPVDTPDFDGDGTPDVLYWNKATGRLVAWFLGGADGTTKVEDAAIAAGSRGFPSTDWMPIE